MRLLPRLLGGWVFAICVPVCAAGSATGRFSVEIRLQAYTVSAPNTVACTGGSVAGIADATVSVVCTGGEFVAIQTDQSVHPNTLLGRTHRFRLEGQTDPHPLTAHLGAKGATGEATALRVLNIQGLASALRVEFHF